MPPRCAAVFDDASLLTGPPANRQSWEALDAFLASSKALGTQQTHSAATAFGQLRIQFTPKIASVTDQEMHCEEDLAICNRECERLYSTMPEQMEEPCKLAVSTHFTGGLSCFPAEAFVQEKRRGKLRIADVKVGDEVAALPGGEFSRVVALLHDAPGAVHGYLCIRFGSGELTLSPQHLLRARRRHRPDSASSAGGACPASSEDPSQTEHWEWLPAEELRPGDELLDCRGCPCPVAATVPAGARGAHAPLTATGTLLVDGVLCSCYAPPSRWAVPHEACHVAMLPLRLLDLLRVATERWSTLKGEDEPLLTVEAMWLLPRVSDKTLHPYASGLLWTAQTALAAADKCRAQLVLWGKAPDPTVQ